MDTSRARIEALSNSRRGIDCFLIGATLELDHRYMQFACTVRQRKPFPRNHYTREVEHQLLRNFERNSILELPFALMI